jgi:hypothetical protein
VLAIHRAAGQRAAAARGWLCAAIPAGDRRWLLLPGLLFTAYGLLLVAPVIATAGRYCFSHYDLGIYSQALARLGWHDPNPWLTGRQIHVFNDHFDPILFLARLPALLVALPLAAVLAEAALVAGATAPLLVGWRRGWLAAPVAALGSALLLFNAATWEAVRYPVHPTTWAMLPMAWLVVAVHRRHLASTFLALNLLFACKEEFPFAGLALGAALLAGRQRRLGGVVLVSALAWLAFDFVVRPRLLAGFTQPYGSGILAGMWTEPAGYWHRRLTAPGMWSRIGSLLVVLAPAGAWAAKARARPDWPVLALLVPVVAVRLVGMSWRHHYGAPLMAGAVVALVLVLATRPLPRWVALATLLLLITTNTGHLAQAGRELLQPRRFPRHCPALPERLAEVGQGLAYLRSHPEGAALVGGNLLAHLAHRDEVYTVGGPQAAGAHRYRYVLVEKPPWGDPFPASPERVGELVGGWRRAPRARVLLDTPHVFLAEGRFTHDR